MATRIRQKAEARIANKDNRPYAKGRFIRIAPNRVRIILDLVRGKGTEEAIAILENSPQKAAVDCLKVLKSAIANAENNKGLNRADLIIAEAFVGAGPTMKRMQPRAKGAGYPILKRSSHITIILDSRK